MQGRQWRKKPSENLIKLMEESVDIKLFLVQERGPLSLLFQDEQGKKFSITIGNDISCSCGGGKNEHCVHTLFALNKVYKIPFNDPLILQLHFTDQELNKLMEKKKKKHNNNNEDSNNNNNRKNNKRKKLENENSNQMNLIDDSVCPICQEDLYTEEGIYYCSNSCGHNFHIGCLKIFIKHKKDNETVIQCPMCRAKWNEEEFDKKISSIQIGKSIKIHKGINCSNCQRSNIKFERFHCLECDNYNLCSECFSNEIHRETAHHFIVKKNSEDKWFGCDFKNFFDEEKMDKKNIHRIYIIKNIYLSQFLSSCLPEYNKNLLNKEEEEDEYGNNAPRDPNDLRNFEEEEKKEFCSVCKSLVKTNLIGNKNKISEFMMIKYIPNCRHVIHVKCCDRAFKIIGYEKHNNILLVDKLFNKCRIDNKFIFPGLNSIKFSYEAEKKISSNNLNNNNIINGVFLDKLMNGNNNDINNNNNFLNINPVKKLPSSSSIQKRQLINKLLMEANMDYNNYPGNNYGFGLNIQKVNFNMNNDIQKFEQQIEHKNTYNTRIKSKNLLNQIPYRQVQKVKKMDSIIAKNNINENKKVERGNSRRETNNNNPLINAGNSLIVQKYNARPVRYENNSSKISLSPLLINLDNL